jgi:hypothetical protein
MSRVFLLISPVLIFYFVITILERRPTGVNEMSRYAVMAALKEEGTFSIDNYLDWTHDWALAPNGKYYSNKAPGSIIIAYPIFYVLDEIFGRDLSDPRTKIPQSALLTRVLLSLILQAVPFLIVAIYGAKLIYQQTGRDDAVIFYVFSLLLGNTASWLSALYMGHALSAALITLSVLLVFSRGSIFLSSFLCSLSILSEYSTVPLFPFVIIGIFLMHGFSRNTLMQVLSGGFLPGIIWCWYHWSFFGSPLSTANFYNNPEFIENVNEKFGGSFSYLPDSQNVLQLLLGPSRGILVTQPWVFLVLIAALVFARRSKELCVLSLISILGFIALLWMNASFNGAPGGLSPGPRYMSAVFPIIAFLGGVLFRYIPKYFKILLWMCLIVSVVFRGILFSTSLFVPIKPVWVWGMSEMIGNADYYGMYGIAIFVSGIIIVCLNLKLGFIRYRA